MKFNVFIVCCAIFYLNGVSAFNAINDFYFRRASKVNRNNQDAMVFRDNDYDRNNYMNPLYRNSNGLPDQRYATGFYGVPTRAPNNYYDNGYQPYYPNLNTPFSSPDQRNAMVYPTVPDTYPTNIYNNMYYPNQNIPSRSNQQDFMRFTTVPTVFPSNNYDYMFKPIYNNQNGLSRSDHSVTMGQSGFTTPSTEAPTTEKRTTSTTTTTTTEAPLSSTGASTSGNTTTTEKEGRENFVGGCATGFMRTADGRCKPTF